MLNFMCGTSAEIKRLTGEVGFMHYLCKKISNHVHSQGSSTSGPATPGTNFKKDRITQYIPCNTYNELQHLNEKLDSPPFFSRAVRNHFLVFTFYASLQVLYCSTNVMSLYFVFINLLKGKNIIVLCLY